MAFLHRPSLASHLLISWWGKGLAGMVVTTMALFASGCLVTEELQGRESDPPKVNHPPYILEGWASPSNFQVVKLSTQDDCASRAFEIRVVGDQDLEDELWAVWYVDFDPSPGKPKTHYGRNQITSAPNEQGERLGPPATSYKFSSADFKKDNKTEFVLKISISDFEPAGDDPMNVPEGRYAVSYSWTIDTSGCTGGVP
jgi:hypothetical protein